MRHAQAWVVKLVLSGHTFVSEQKPQASIPGVKTGPEGPVCCCLEGALVIVLKKQIEVTVDDNKEVMR
jgi:hypothetical protein